MAKSVQDSYLCRQLPFNYRLSRHDKRKKQWELLGQSQHMNNIPDFIYQKTFTIWVAHLDWAAGSGW
jgi:hypothetical protein